MYLAALLIYLLSRALGWALNWLEFRIEPHELFA